MFNFLKNRKQAKREKMHQKLYQEMRETDLEFRKLDDEVLKGDDQLRRIGALENKSDVSNLEMIDLYKQIIEKEGMAFNGPFHLMKYLNLLYKENMMDEAWRVTNLYSTMYPDLFFKIEEFRTKLLKKEKRYKDALNHQLAAIIYYNRNTSTLSQEKVDKKINPILNKGKLNISKESIYQLIIQETEERDFKTRRIRDELKKLLEE